MSLFDDLNESQKEAAAHIDGPMLILAGAGSGKTKTITTRLAYLIDEVGINAANTLTLTFTNKAANVMRTRALNLMRNQNHAPLLCTFHKFGLIFLRLYIQRIYRKNDFNIIDTDDNKKIIKEILINLNLNKENPAQIMAYISKCKNNFKSPSQVLEDINALSYDNEILEKKRMLARIYSDYQAYLLKFNFVDFDDLLLLTNQILSEDLAFAKVLSAKYNFLMVDEYQDTNALQHQILKHLCTSHENICVVGDDDQSIYSWRGARVENILNFKHEFENVKIVKLEQNYRSVGVILNAANKLISHNEKRLGKELICTKEKGENVIIKECFDEKDESLQVALSVKKLLSSGVSSAEIAVLFRINALSRALETAFMKENVPYKLLSGMRFYERQEIKDLIAYFRFLSNLNDDFSLKRILNVPKRGFGKMSLEKLESYAKNENISLFEALCNVENSGFFSKKLDNEISKFIQNIREIKEAKDLVEMIDLFEDRIKLRDYYSEVDENERVQNINEFYADMKDRALNAQSLSEILSEISLLSEQDGLNENCVYMMSIHASKGLEFDYVFIVGLEEGLFPLSSDLSDMEEERRLAYVAITRAKKSLTLTYTQKRFYHGNSNYDLKKSRFLLETGLIKGENFNTLSQKLNLKENLSLDEDLDKISEKQKYQKGDLIKHKILGIGRVVGVQNAGQDEFLSLNFGGKVYKINAKSVSKI